MPNHIRNALTITGPARDVATFVMLSQHPRPRTGDTPRYVNGRQVNPNFQEEARDPQPFDFQGVVPLPERYSQVPYDEQGEGLGYAIEKTTWGVKWGPYDMNPAKHIEIAEHAATFRFTTANGVPRQYYLTASLRFPRCLLATSYGGEGPCYGRALYYAGSVREEIDGEYAALPPYTEEDEGEAQQAGIAQYLTTHAAWVAELIAEGS